MVSVLKVQDKKETPESNWRWKQEMWKSERDLSDKNLSE